MDSRLLLTIIGLPIYLFLVIYFRRYRQWLLYYLMGAFGLTMLIALPMEYLNWDYYLVGVEIFHVTLLGKLIGISGDLLESGRILLETGGGSSILKIGIECSGVLEAGVLIGLVAFYPVFTTRSKLLKIVFGLAVTYLINILRMLIIVLIVAKFGTDYVFIAHAVIGRLFFFTLAIALYWYILTKPTLKIVGEAVDEGKLSYEIHHRLNRARVLRKGVKLTSIAIIAILFTGSFAISGDWRKAFSTPTVRPSRPLIYAEETSAEPLPESTWQGGRVLGAYTEQPPPSGTVDNASSETHTPDESKAQQCLLQPAETTTVLEVNYEPEPTPLTEQPGATEVSPTPPEFPPSESSPSVGESVNTDNEQAVSVPTASRVLGVSTDAGAANTSESEKALLWSYIKFFSAISILFALTLAVLMVWILRLHGHGRRRAKKEGASHEQ